MYSHDTYCPTDPSSPKPVGFCDRCNRKFYLDELVWQLQWTAATLSNTYLRVCTKGCLDVPNEQNRVIVIGPDPVPLKDPRPGFQVAEEAAQGVPPIPPYVEDGDT